MQKRERFKLASRGEKVDQAPVGAWIHYGSALWDPQLTAQVHRLFCENYDWDFLKVMNDYRFPTLNNFLDPTTPKDLLAIGHEDADYSNFEFQREVLKDLHVSLPSVPLIETIFSPASTVVRTLGDRSPTLFQEDREIAKRVMQQVADQLIRYLSSVDEFIDGVYFAVNGASHDRHGWGTGRSEFADLIAPFDKQVLEALDGKIKVVHVHGYDLDIARVADYPIDILSWSHNQTSPTLEEVASAGDWVPMGGLDEVESVYWAPNKIYEHVMHNRRRASNKLIVAPGCTLPADIPPSVLRALVKAAREPLA